ncbi:hypothetical protein THAOC_16715 [Thalassiosira oceanica]|uniref:Uncharacterized protein n=1 Tax=Thalassiosira oceanica TaxID=159749 RepID=K0S965_THAOC|nr:hypothetical protein THAOC_16715 [Thalassiosira oceanica]|eukprot:EJK62663.1 hypothetical protein THAOC_16715 [Thalassiosira oceanica]
MDRVSSESFQSEYVSDALAAMLDKERSTQYLRIMPRLDSEYACDRRRVIDWCYSLIERRRCKPSIGTVESADSPKSAPSSQDMSDICLGEYSAEEISSEELCIIQTLSWYIFPVTGSHVAQHVLALVDCVDTVSEDYMAFLEGLHSQIECSIRDVGLTTSRRPSSIALAAILNSAKNMTDVNCRQVIIRTVMLAINRFDFDSPWDIDAIQQDIMHLSIENWDGAERSIDTSPQTHEEQAQATRLAFQHMVSQYGGYCELEQASNTQIMCESATQGQLTERGDVGYYCGPVQFEGEESVSDEDVRSDAGIVDEDEIEERTRQLTQNPRSPQKRSRLRRSSTSSLHSGSRSTTTLETIPEGYSLELIRSESFNNVSILSLRDFGPFMQFD